MTGQQLMVEGVSKRFGGVVANDNISLSVPKGSIVGLIGPNGIDSKTRAEFTSAQSRYTLAEGEDQLVAFQHPTKRMKRVYCNSCGETLFNTNAMDWRIVSQLLISKCYADGLPEPLRSKMHFFYGRRVVDVDDPLPKRD